VTLTADSALHAGTATAALAEDAALLERLRTNDAAAFAQLFDAYHGRLVRLALSFVPSHSVAEEVVQETWLAVLDGLSRFEARSGLRTWVFRILVNRAKTRGARERRSVPFSSFSSELEDEAPAVDPSRFEANGHWCAPPRKWETDAADSVLMRRQSLEHLQVALAALPDAQRAVLVLRDIDGLDSAEVCNVLEISETNQRVLLHRARSKLRAALEAYVDRI
jgi:RNA polymerase sigma-70 factor (ECF subfamily)